MIFCLLSSAPSSALRAEPVTSGGSSPGNSYSESRPGGGAGPRRSARPPPDRARKPVWGRPDAAQSGGGTRARVREAEAGGRDELPVVASGVRRGLDQARRAGVADDAVGDGRRAE